MRHGTRIQEKENSSLDSDPHSLPRPYHLYNLLLKKSPKSVSDATLCPTCQILGLPLHIEHGRTDRRQVLHFYKMGNTANWDGTLSASEFYASAKALSEKWKLTQSPFPPWTWVSCPRPFGVSSCEVNGYLSLEKLSCPRFTEGDSGDETTSKEPACSINEEPYDEATLIYNNDQDQHFFDLHIVHNTSYSVPVLYFRGYDCDGQPLSLDDIQRDLPCYSSKMIKDSRWTFITVEEHPYLNRPWCLLHPCGTSEWMKLLLTGDAPLIEDGEIIQQYMLSWLSVVGQMVGLRVPLEIVKGCPTPFPVVDI